MSAVEVPGSAGGANEMRGKNLLPRQVDVKCRDKGFGIRFLPYQSKEPSRVRSLKERSEDSTNP